MRRIVVSLALAAISASLYGQPLPLTPRLTLPLRPGSVRFAAIGDMGSGSARQYETAVTMEAFRRALDFEFVIMLLPGGIADRHDR